MDSEIADEEVEEKTMPNKLSHDNSLPNMGSMENLHDNLNEASSIDDQLVAEAYG